MKEKSKLLIKIGILIFALVLMVVLVIISNQPQSTSKENDENNNVENAMNQEASSYDNNSTNENNTKNNTDENSLVRITNTKTYFLMKQCIETYYNSVIGERNFKIIDSKAKKEIDVQQINLLSYHDIPKFCIDRIYGQKINANENMYIVYYRDNNLGITQLAIMVRINTKNEVFSVFPYEYIKQKNYLDLSENKVIDCSDLEEISKNDLSKYYEKNDIDDATYTSELFDRYKFDLKYDNENLYKTINSQYKQEKFSNIQDLKNYISQNKDDLYDEKVVEYKKTVHEKYTELIGYTDKDRSYLFNVSNIMDYTIEFDSYLVMTQQGQEVYENLLPQSQAKYCVNRVIEALNNKDYDFVYSRLNPILKNNYYKTEDDFIKFINSTFYSMNSYELEKDYLKVSSNIYQFDIKIYDSQSDIMSYNWIKMAITLNDNADFTVSIVKK